MVRAGEDPAFIFRRMIILASEDVGMADPNALSVVLSCASSFERIGFPEGNYPLSHACIYLATAPKSNSTMAFFDALKEVEKEDADIPSHLKDASRDKESFGHGEGYIYPHAYREHWTAQQYLPQTLQGKTFYMPSKIGYEGKICDVVLKRREIQAAIVFSENSLKNNTREEILSWNSPSKDKEEWFKRLESGRSGLLLSDRDAIIKEASPTRSSRILILQGGDGLLLWESLRKAPEGLVACTVENEKEKDALLCFAKTTLLNEDEKPIISVDSLLPSKAEEVFGCGVFDIIIARELWRHASPVFSSFAMDVKQLLSKNGVLVLLNSPPAAGERLSRILQEECPNAPLSIIEKLKLGEESFFKQKTERLWTEEAFTSAFKMAGFKTKITYLTQKEERLILEKDLSVWFASVWGRYMGETIGIETCEQIKALLAERAKRGPILWKWSSMLSRHVL
jgi:putative ATPase